MIIARSPLRVTLGGGGTDLPSYYEKFGGFLIAAAIDKYVYITLHDTFVPDLIVKYSELERVPDAAQLKHPIMREAFALVGMDGHSLELTSMADIPPGTGLGSSGSFTTALLKALHAHKRNLVHPAELAAQACEIELEPLEGTDWQTGPIHRGLWRHHLFQIFAGRQCRGVAAESFPTKRATTWKTICFCFSPAIRARASAILKEQDQKSKSDDKAMIENLHFVKDLGCKASARWKRGDLREFARLMDVHWQRKKQRSGGMSNPKINEWYDLAMANGALGGKLIGAGGGGF